MYLHATLRRPLFPNTRPAPASLSADISGTVPDLSALKKLRQLDIEFNFLRGQLDGQLLCPEGNRLNALMLRANNFTGSLNLSSCGNLTVLDLAVRGGGAGARCIISMAGSGE